MSRSSGFTLVELSVVLVVIGLIVGGVMVGRDLIKAAEIRATISQIEKYKTAANTFKLKYEYLPGDILSSKAAQIGLKTFSGAAAGIQGRRDGNGVIEGYYDSSPPSLYAGSIAAIGETCLFWVDLTGASGVNVNLIEGNYIGSTAGVAQNDGICSLGVSFTTGEHINDYFPKAKIGNGNYVYVWSGGGQGNPNPTNNNGINYFGIGKVYQINGFSFIDSTDEGISPNDAYMIDSKIDDGIPMTGSVTTLYTGSWVLLSENEWNPAITSSTVKCFNQNVGGNSFYFRQNPNTNCALSFKFQ